MIIYFLIYFITIASAIFYGKRIYHTFLTPVAHYGAYCIIASVIAPILFLELGFSRASENAYKITVTYEIIYWLSINIAFLSPRDPFRHISNKIYSVLHNKNLNKPPIVTAYLIPILIYVTSVSILIIFSGAGFLWLTSPRIAYEKYRSGVGFVWSIASASLSLLFIIIAHRHQLRFKKIIIPFLCCLFLAFFLGGKSIVLSFFIYSIFMYDAWIRPLKIKYIIFCFILLLTLSSFLLLFQSNNQSPIYFVQYFDYFENTAYFLNEKPSGYMFGKLALSNFWSYIPRSMYSSKPFVYGQMNVTEITFPGAAELGFTPGISQWIAIYWDFGIIGIILKGLLVGFWSKSFFLIMRERKNYIAAILFFQFSFIYYIEFFWFAPIPIFLIFMWMYKKISIFTFNMQTRWSKKNKLPREYK
jgi:hypothetical protein